MAINVPPPNRQELSKRVNVSVETIDEVVDLVRMGMLPVPKRISVSEEGQRRYYFVERRGVGILQTKFGDFWLYTFRIEDAWMDYYVAVRAELNPETLNPVFSYPDRRIVLRIDSGCATGQIFGDLTCDCQEQLDQTLASICQIGEGMVINIPKQDGRGMGLSFKLATLWVQEKLGVDTIESAALLSPDSVIDARTYSGVIAILKFFDIPLDVQIELATNNPQKKNVFPENGYTVNKTLPVVTKPTPHTIRHLLAKQEQLGHKGLVPEDER